MLKLFNLGLFRFCSTYPDIIFSHFMIFFNKANNTHQIKLCQRQNGQKGIDMDKLFNRLFVALIVLFVVLIGVASVVEAPAACMGLALAGIGCGFVGTILYAAAG